jgi:hypothetical protein
MTGCVFAPNASPCDDGNMCTLGDTCKDGACVAGLPVYCDDGNDCTADSCAPESGCVHVTAPEGSACTDGNACTNSDKCTAGKCVGVGTQCNDNNPCTDDLCGPEWGGCYFPPNSKPCDDNNMCTTGDTCTDGACKSTGTLVCGDGNPCTDDLCDPVIGCFLKYNTAACDDKNACTIGDTCSNSVCAGTAPLACDDGNPCTNDSCNPASGCVFAPNTNPCNDNNPCTTGDACAEGSCKPGGPTDCSDGNVCTTDLCNQQLGCIYQLNTNPCDDGNACTSGDLCGSGSCKAGVPVSCDDGNACTTDSCDPVLGCAHVNNTNPCNDNNNCTTNDHCSAGFCTGSLPANCLDTNPCTDDLCDPVTGCYHTFNTAACSDNNQCTTGDTCGSGVCFPGQPTNCNDGNPCTNDTCSNQNGCQHQPVQWNAPCNDGNACTTGEACHNGQCNGGQTTQCGDGNPCTTDSCDPVTGQCAHANNTNPCTISNNNCTTGGVCANGTCQLKSWTCTGSCCVQKNSPGCANQAVALCVCGQDAGCCNSPWDDGCAALADECGSCNGSCCSPHQNPGCQNENTEFCVCVTNNNMSCCLQGWTAACVQSAVANCGVNCN